MRVRVKVVVQRMLVGTFEGDSLDECVRDAEMEARNHGELMSIHSLVEEVTDKNSEGEYGPGRPVGFK